ncbi:bifunctional protein tyrosine phosphatase family protein/NAD(P)/FAD-dependent oxidoreductase [Rugamonas sp.]|uniref:bifunctional protein tyrosine phosphatase family protein/NAD(P)/FAD-dependent oxidoreductase n=1 Tax=Rugamonas sp. TaxID=1926287 RepID=UPI0025D689F8|nr:bifunctional protein tyrosine phosphatase family protein/NAD(P)/FAD-dependent oxidoreductase [Rugamonas sp.]
MEIHQLAPGLSISAQVLPEQLAAIRAAGFLTIICNRPDAEGVDQPAFAEIEGAALALGMTAHYLPAESGKVSDEQVRTFGQLREQSPQPVLAYCRTGMRSTTMWALSQAEQLPLAQIIDTAKKAGFDLKGLVRRILEKGRTPADLAVAAHTVLVIGGGAAGIATAASLLARDPGLDIAIIDPSEVHYYQPGWTLVGAGVFDAADTARTMASTIPRGAHWIKSAVAAFEPERNAVILEGGKVLKYEQLVICPGLKLDWQAIEGLSDTLGRNGVTSNYRYDLAPYTWQLIRNARGGRAIFTQPPMPIKCAGAPQKAMYLAADHWRRHGLLGQMEIEFRCAGAVLFGVADYVPALMEYIDAYGVGLHFGHTLTSVDGPAKLATFSRNTADGGKEFFQQPFDMLHVVPPQVAPDFIRISALADAAGWLDVDPATLRHKTWPNIHALGDVVNTSNAKTAAAARKQAPVVAHNVLAALGRARGKARYDGYGSCPLTVERGKIVLAEFTYGGKLAPSFPAWLIDGTRPSQLAWLLKERILPPLYWMGMLKGREWMAKPRLADL